MCGGCGCTVHECVHVGCACVCVGGEGVLCACMSYALVSGEFTSELDVLITF